MLKVGSHVRWTSDGGFSYVGKLVGDHDGVYSIDTEHGIIGVPHDDGKFEPIKKPKGFHSDVVSVTPIAPKKKSARRARGASGVSKLDQVVKLLQDEPHLVSTRKAAIERIVTVVGMTPAGASTYYSNAKKRLT